MTSFSEQDYVESVFANIDAAHEVITDVEFDACRFNDCDFTEAVIERCRFIDCEFSNCNFSNAQLRESRMREVLFDNCKLVGVDWTRLDWPNLSLPSPLTFQSCLLSHGSFFGLELAELNMQYCKAHEADFRSANLSEGRFNFTDFLGSQFHQCDLSGADFEHACNYAIDVFNNRVKGARFSRDEALSLLSGLDIELV